MKNKTVPVVVYENGNRRVIGEAEVEFADGLVLMTAEININEVPLLFSGMENAFSLGLTTKEAKCTTTKASSSSGGFSSG